MRARRTVSARSWVTIVGTALTLIALGDLLVLERHYGATGSWLDLSRGDAAHYIAMVRGEPASLPYADRIAAPAIASVLPLPAEFALKVVNLASLAALYVTGGWLIVRLGMSAHTACLALVVAWSTVGHLFAYQNPYLVDTPATAAVTGMVAAAMTGASVVFLLLATSTLIRETNLAAAPIALLSSARWVGFAALAVGIAAATVVRWGNASDLDAAIVWPDHDFNTAARGALTYGYVWLPALAGLVMYRGPRRLTLHVAAGLLLVGALLTLLVANDVPRLLSITYPVALVGVAIVLDRVGTYWSTFAGAYTGMGVVATFPTVMTSHYTQGISELDEWYVELGALIIGYQFVGLVLYGWLVCRGARRSVNSPTN